MQADFAVELGPDDETLEFPWTDQEGKFIYCDLKRYPELLSEIVEAQDEPGLTEFLSAMNSTNSGLETAKCDVWASTEINPEEEIFGATCKFGSYVDLLFTGEAEQSEFDQHEHLAAKITDLLRKAPEMPASAEFLIRRCYYRQGQSHRSGFYFTFYLFGYGDDEAQAHKRWVIGLKLVENAIRQAVR